MAVSRSGPKFTAGAQGPSAQSPAPDQIKCPAECKEGGEVEDKEHEQLQRQGQALQLAGEYAADDESEEQRGPNDQQLTASPGRSRWCARHSASNGLLPDTIA